MSVVYVLLLLALVIVGVAVGAFVWAARRGQFDDLETPAMRIVLDDEETPTAAAKDAHDDSDKTTGAEPKRTNSAPTS